MCAPAASSRTINSVSNTEGSLVWRPSVNNQTPTGSSDQPSTGPNSKARGDDVAVSSVLAREGGLDMVICILEKCQTGSARKSACKSFKKSNPRALGLTWDRSRSIKPLRSASSRPFSIAVIGRPVRSE